MKKILIANRGEIARRIIRTAHKMDIDTVAVYSDADRGSLHVQEAGESIHIGASPSSESYLDMDKIIAAAKKTGADAIHPGYGFLSENAIFARKVKESNIIFIGPSPESISLMGDKLSAKDTVKKYDIPMVPGTDRAIKNISEASGIAKEIGFPILIKAAAGGGGKGMRIVEKESGLISQMERAVSEAESSFGNGAVFIEKYIKSPRHIEIQILADKHGNVIHLFERECSIQRRHQKVIEEAPSSVLSQKLREEMGEAAIKVARSCGYEGAGTVEFLLDDNHHFYFLEMNTRLQVEHPVTEMITGIDLVEQQIKIAIGEKMEIKQEDIKIKGHAIELRVYAEDPVNDFLPSIGKLTQYATPQGDGIRVDDAYQKGQSIPIFYDPMIAKLTTYAGNRDQAIALMKKAIDTYTIGGIETTLGFGRYVMEHEAFKKGMYNTHFIKNDYDPKKLELRNKEMDQLAAILAAKLYQREVNKIKIIKNPSKNWSSRN